MMRAHDRRQRRAARQVPSARKLRQRREARQGWQMIALAMAGFAAMAGGAAYVDSAQGVSIDQSLTAWGL